MAALIAIRSASCSTSLPAVGGRSPPRLSAAPHFPDCFRLRATFEGCDARRTRRVLLHCRKGSREESGRSLSKAPEIFSASSPIWVASSNSGPSSQRLLPAKRSVAVLPFKLLTPNPSDEYLSMALADAVINHLSSSGELLVRPAQSVSRYAQRETDPLAAARDLNVHVVVDGSIQKLGR